MSGALGTAGGAAGFAGGAGSSGECVDSTFCDDKCGSQLIDACGRAQDCSTDCGDNHVCNGVTKKCECVPISTWCSGKCGETRDNCGEPVDCGPCASGSCVDNACGCVPDNTAACGERECGSALNNCGQTVNCGPSEGQCAGGGRCSDGRCCDAPSVTCGSPPNQQCGVRPNNCGEAVDCGGCTQGFTCAAATGSCECTTPNVVCGSICVNTAFDLANCGACGRTCAVYPNADTCEQGGCACSGHGFNTDPAACGPCPLGGGVNCLGLTCQSGVCR
jgi:hypothetical protein